MEMAEKNTFVAAGLDRKTAQALLTKVLSDMGIAGERSDDSMASVHWLLFACLAGKEKTTRILEIGTFTGETTAVIARLFPEAEIVTLDLPGDDPILRSTYQRLESAKFAAYEERLISNTSAPNVKLIRRNSFFVPEIVEGRFDLVWVDGGHLYPEIAWDLCNAYHLLRPGGVLMCDDVIPDSNGLRDSYVSPDSHAVLRYITERTHDPMWLFLKRIASEWSADPRERKYVALLEKRMGARNAVS